MFELGQSCFLQHVVVAGDGLPESLFQSAERGFVWLGPAGLVHVVLQLSVGLLELDVLAEEGGVELLILLLGSLEFVLEAIILLVEPLDLFLVLFVVLYLFAVGLVQLLVLLLQFAV